MSGPDDLPPIDKIQTPGTDKITPPGTDPTSHYFQHSDGSHSLIKADSPATDPVAKMSGSPTDPLAKMSGSPTDPLSQVALNPQPLPPGPSGKGGKDPGPISRGLRNTIIIVCLIGLLLVGGGFALQSLRTQSAGSGSITVQPGVIQLQKQFQVSQSAHDQSSGAALCASTVPQSALLQRLVGGGFTADDDHGITVFAQSSYPNGGNSGDTWGAYFLPQAQAHLATAVAVCLREPSTFFSGLQSFDTVESPAKLAANDDKYPPSAIAVATCPAGDALLGGGYASQYSGGGVYSIDASYPAYTSGVGAWNVAFHIDPSNGLQRVQVNAYAICSNGLATHVEQAPLPGPNTKVEPFVQGALGCSAGSLLRGGYQFTGSGPALVSVGDDSPLNDATRSPASGDFVQQWYIEAEATGWQAHTSPGNILVVCLDSTTSATPGATPTDTSVSTPAATNTPRPTATATPKPRPTNTPVPQCQQILTGAGAMNVDNTYLNVDSASGIGHNSAVAQVQFSPASGLLTALNGATLSDQGTIGSGGYNRFTCTQLKGSTYGASSVPATNGEVFFVKVADGHLAKVLVTVTPGNPFPSFTWTTYKP